MTIVEIYVLLEYSALIPILVGILRWNRMSFFLKWHLLAILILFLGDSIANSFPIVGCLNEGLNSIFKMNIDPRNNLPIYLISYPLSLSSIIYAWLQLPEYDKSSKKFIYTISVIPVIAVIIWSIIRNWLAATLLFQDFAFIVLLHAAVLLLLSLRFFHIFLNTDVFVPQLNNALFFVACAYVIYAIPSTFIIIFSEVYNSQIATDIWIGREVAYCTANLILALAFFISNNFHR